MSATHLSVLLAETLAGLLGSTPAEIAQVATKNISNLSLTQPAELVLPQAKNLQGRYVDATFGRGGHSRALLAQLGSDAQLLGLDKDPQAIAAGKELEQEDPRFTILQGSFADLPAHLASLGWDKIDGLMADLGVSSPQLDQAERGFSFMQSGPLDMRMDTTQGITAAEWLAKASEAEINDVLFFLGEERHARRMARALVAARQEEAITTTGQLAEIVKAANPRWEKHKHPATRAFQAIRLHINSELTDLEKLLENSLDLLKPKARLAIISFHSLEDRRVKRFMRDAARGNAAHLPANLPVTQDQLNAQLKLIGRAIKPSAEEININPRARSAILRVAEKI